MIAGWVATLFLASVVQNTRIKYDTALGLILSVFFGFGLMLLTFIQRRPDATQAGLDKFPFGQAATLLSRDVLIITVLGALALAVLAVLWKEFKLLCFDSQFGASQGFPMRFLDFVLTSLLVIAIVLGLEKHAHAVEVLRAMNPNPDSVQSSLKVLEERGWAYQAPGEGWLLAAAGLEQAQNSRNGQKVE